VHPTFSEEEVDRLARRLAITPQQFIDSYLERSEPHSDNPWKTRTTLCPFLKENHCSVYEERPADCSGYPFVYEVMEELKKSLGFPKRYR